MEKDRSLLAIGTAAKHLGESPDLADSLLALCANHRLVTGNFIEMHEPIETNGDTFAAVADDGALCLIDAANGVVTVNGETIARGPLVHRRHVSHLPMFVLGERNKRRLCVVFDADHIEWSEPFDEIDVRFDEHIVGYSGKDRVLLGIDRDKKLVSRRCCARAIEGIFAHGDVVLVVDVRGKRKILDIPSGISWDIRECEVIDVMRFGGGVAVYVRFPNRCHRLAIADITEEAIPLEGDLEGYGGKYSFQPTPVLSHGYGASRDEFVFSSHGALHFVPEKEWILGVWRSGARDIDVRVFPYVIETVDHYHCVSVCDDRRQFSFLGQFEQKPVLHRMAHVVALTAARKDESLEVRWGDRLEYGVPKGAWRKIDFSYAHIMARGEFSKLVAPAWYVEGGPWQITDGIVKYGPTLRQVIRTLPFNDGTTLRVWGWNGNTLVSFTATIYT